MSDQPNTPPAEGGDEQAPADTKPTIQFDDFMKLDLRVATIAEAAEHPNADKLIVLTLDVGDHQRQVLAGLRQWYEPAELVGKQVVVVVNLAPRKMRGLESQGMLLAASTTEDDSRDVVFLTTEKPVPAGSKVS